MITSCCLIKERMFFLFQCKDWHESVRESKACSEQTPIWPQFHILCKQKKSIIKVEKKVFHFCRGDDWLHFGRQMDARQEWLRQFGPRWHNVCIFWCVSRLLQTIISIEFLQQNKSSQSMCTFFYFEQSLAQPCEADLQLQFVRLLRALSGTWLPWVLQNTSTIPRRVFCFQQCTCEIRICFPLTSNYRI